MDKEVKRPVHFTMKLERSEIDLVMAGLKIIKNNALLAIEHREMATRLHEACSAMTKCADRVEASASLPGPLRI